MPYDPNSPMGDAVQAGQEDVLDTLRRLSERGIFVHDPAFYYPLHHKGDGKLKVRAPFWGGGGLMIDTTGDVDIGHYCFFDDFVVIYTHTHGYGTQLRFYDPIRIDKKIGAFVYLAPRVTVLAGCQEIGEGARALPGAVLDHDVEAWTVVGGNPAGVVSTIQKPEKWLESLKALFEKPVEVETHGQPGEDE